jgi:2-dehydropantoate 2-reductase
VKLAVVGAGAIGGTVGAYLVRAGHEVTFVDVERDHVSAIRSSGLRITGPVDAFTVTAPAFTPDEVPGTFEVVVLAVKAHATAAALRDVVRFLAPDGYVASFQNGLNELEIAEAVGAERTMGCFVNFGADYIGPGEIHYGGRGAVVLGELDGSDSERLRALHEAILAFEPRAVTTGNIWGYLWAKLAVGAMLFTTALTDDSIADCLAAPAYRRLFTAIAQEVTFVALARGVTLERFDGFDPSAFLPGTPRAVSEASLDAMVAFNRRSAKTHTGVWRDLAVRRRRTEVDLQLGPIPRLAAEVGRAAPLVERIVAMIHEVEQGTRERGRHTLDELERVRVSHEAAA